MNISFSIRRKIIQFIAFVLMNPHISNLATGSLYKGPWKNFCSPGLNCYSCPAAGLSCPIGALQTVNGSLNFKWSFYVAGTVCASGILLGRAVCGFLCPFGLLQELIHKIPFYRKKLPRWTRYIKYGILAVPVLALPVFVTNAAGMGDPFFCKYICPAGTLEGGLPLLAVLPKMRSMAGARFAVKILIAAAVLAGCLMTPRFFCKVLCPLGALYGFFNKISLVRLQSDPQTCLCCDRCRQVCPMDINPAADLNSMECIRCGRCVNTCHAKAIWFDRPDFLMSGDNNEHHRIIQGSDKV